MSTFIDRYSSKQFVLKKNETKLEILKKLSHLYLNGKHIEEIGEISSCQNLRVLYLHNNNIETIRNCNELINLTHLYLQWNKIRKIDNMNGLRNLKKLYLGNNEIRRLENIDRLIRLEELHIERQKITNGRSLDFEFDANSLCGIANSLKVLNISGLQLNRLEMLWSLKRLRELNASDNLFVCAEEIARFLKAMPYLNHAHFKGCPAQKNDLHYRDIITAGTDVLAFLDDKQISNNARYFLQRFAQAKADKLTRKLSKQNRQSTENEIVEELTEMFEKKYLDHMETNFSLMNASDDDELSFKAWQSLKLRDSRSSKKISKNIKHIFEREMSRSEK